MKKLITIIVLAIVSANTYGQYITPVGTAQWFKKNVYFGSDTTNANAVIRTNGKVGIGTSNPANILDVYGGFSQRDTANGWYYSLSNFGGSPAHYQGFFSWDSLNGNRGSLIGIGNDTIVLSAVSDLANLNFTNITMHGSSMYLGQQTGLQKNSILLNNNGIEVRGYSPLGVNTQWQTQTGDTIATIRNNGRLGIGTSNPTQTLTVHGSLATTYVNGGKKYLFLSNSMAHGIAVQDSVTNAIESQVAIDPNYVLIKNSIGTNINRAFFSVYNEDNLIMGFGNSALNNKSNTIRFDSTTKFVVGINASEASPNMQWVDSSYTPRASLYNNGALILGSASSPQQTLDVRGSARIDSSLILAGEFYTQTDSVFTIPDDITTVIINAPGGFSTATITMPPNPSNGQIISLAVGSNGIGTLTVSPNSGQTVSSGTPVLHNGSISYRYRLANSTWYRW